MESLKLELVVVISGVQSGIRISIKYRMEYGTMTGIEDIDTVKI